MTFVRNAWYVAGWAREFGRELRRVTILGENLVMFRASNGKVAALRDRCPHKCLPLSKGHLVGDEIECGYHGSVFGADGRCVRIPGQPRVPPSACVRAFPVHERRGIVWVWTGDPGKADPDGVFDLDQLGDPQWDAHQGDALRIGSNYLNVAENLIDPAHVAFVHPTTLGSDAHAEVPVECDASADPIYTWRWIRDAPPNPFFRKYGNFRGNVDRWQYLYLYLPSIAVIDFGSVDAKPGSTEDRRGEGIRLFAVHLLTPVSERETIDRWMHIRNTHLGDEDMARVVDKMFRTAFAEDKVVLEAIQLEEEKPGAVSTLRLAIDRGPIAYRARIGELAEAELADPRQAGFGI